MNEGTATGNAATLGFYYLRDGARTWHSAMFYPVKAMRVEPILCVGLMVQSASGQAASRTPASDAEASLREGIVAQQHGDFKAAIANFRRALVLEPDMIQAHASLGAALAAAGQMQEAMEEDTRILDIAPQNDAVRMNLAMAYYQTGNLNQARVEFEKLHAARPADLKTSLLLAYTYNKLKRESEAVDLLAPLERGHEDDFDFEYVYAYALIASGRPEDGLPRMEKLAKARNSAEAWLVAGSTRFYRKEMELAQADLDAAIQINPKLQGLYTLDGQARYGHGDAQGAIPVFEAALRADPSDFMANLYLGTIRLEQRNLDEAEPLLNLALQLRPNWPLARLQVAKLNELRGRLPEAVRILEELEKTDPEWLEPHVSLAAAYYRLKRPIDGDRERKLVQQIEAQQPKKEPRKP